MMAPIFVLGAWVPMAGVTLALCIGPEPDHSQPPASAPRSRPGSLDVHASAAERLPGTGPNLSFYSRQASSEPSSTATASGASPRPWRL
jgi:hypothetical protein